MGIAHPPLMRSPVSARILSDRGVFFFVLFACFHTHERELPVPALPMASVTILQLTSQPRPRERQRKGTSFPINLSALLPGPPASPRRGDGHPW
jgi:hypothetical protein